jgi:hypothetical protein
LDGGFLLLHPIFNVDIKMTKLLYIIFFFICLTPNLYADCRGCCNGHGGIVCANGVTRCVDGTPLSDKCKTKGCSACEEPATAVNAIKIASFNIQVFGKAKASKPEIIEVLADIISQFDVVAIQEIRDKTGKAIKDLEVAVDALGENYDFIIDPPDSQHRV